MKRVLQKICLMGALALTAWPLAYGAGAGSAWILETNPSQLSGVLSRHNLALREVLRSGIYQVWAPANVPAAQLSKDVKADPSVDGFEADQEVDTPERISSGALKPSLAQLAPALADRSVVTYFGDRVRGAYVNQTAARMIEISAAISRFGSGKAIVAVIDTGVDPTHPALRNVLVPGYDFTRNVAGYASEFADLTQSTVAILDQSTVAILDGKNYPAILNQSTVAILDQSTVAILDGKALPSDFGHGTMVSGLIHLVAPGARIMPLKAFQSDGSSNLSDIIRAIYYAVDHGATVINMSFSTTTPSPGMQAALAYAAAHGVVGIASAGNDGSERSVYPAAYRGTIGVGSVNFSDLRSTFSNYDADGVRTSAPGEAVVTTYPGNNYAGVWGSSFSTALVSGAAALMLEVNPRMSSDDMMDALDHGKPIQQDMGNARLDILLSLLWTLTQN